MRLRLIPLCLAALLLTVPNAYADTIVDTGPGPAVETGWGLLPRQWLAAEFTITEFVTISFFGSGLDVCGFVR